MTEQDFQRALRETPDIRAIFRINRVPVWVQRARLGVHVGMQCIHDDGAYLVTTMGLHGKRVVTRLAEMPPSMLTFIGYEDCRMLPLRRVV